MAGVRMGATGRYDAVGFKAFDGRRYLNLETYRRNGKGVRTPVWFAAAPPDSGAAKLYAYTIADSGKAKRIRRTAMVRIVPCDVRGRVSGEWITANAELVADAEFDAAMRLINRKYWPWKQILDLSTALLFRHQRVMIAISPTTP